MRIKRLPRPTVTIEEWARLAPKGPSLEDATKETERKRKEWREKEKLRTQPCLPFDFKHTEPELCRSCEGFGTCKGKRCGACKGKGVVPRIPGTTGEKD